MDSKTLICFCMDWHIQFSNAFYQLLVNPLSLYLRIQLVGWDGITFPEPVSFRDKKKETILFAQFPPPFELVNKTDNDFIWIPMWDHAHIYDENWWNSVPKKVRIIAFSGEIWNCASKAGLSTIFVKYYFNPDEYKKAVWENGFVGLYWNRTGLIDPKLIMNICKEIGMTKLFFLSNIDPRIDPRAFYELPSIINKTEIITYSNFLDHKEYLSLLGSANIYFAPRKYEGVGLTFLEAQASGCAVIAYNSPTMNEYIIDGRNGILYREKFLYSFIKKWRKKESPHHLGSDINFKRFRNIEFEAIGNQARMDHKIGFQNWKKQVNDLYNFIIYKQ